MQYFPIIDLHCDLLSYLHHRADDASIYHAEDIGCALPLLQKGNVKVQVMAIYTDVTSQSPVHALGQAQIYHKLPELSHQAFQQWRGEKLSHLQDNNVYTLASIENAAGLLAEDEKIGLLPHRLSDLMHLTGPLAYISLTHHGENRFAGGNYTQVGLKKDGEALLELMAEKGIPIDFSHTSDATANDILNVIDCKNLDLALLASHSNFRSHCNHPRNLPDEIAQEIVNRSGLIGMNFLRAFMHDSDPVFLVEHITHGLRLGGESCLAYGADFFYWKDHPDQSRVPFYLSGLDTALSYSNVASWLQEAQISEVAIEKLSYENAERFYTPILSRQRI